MPHTLLLTSFSDINRSDDILKSINICDAASHMTVLENNFLEFYHPFPVEMGGWEGGGRELFRLIFSKSQCGKG